MTRTITEQIGWMQIRVTDDIGKGSRLEHSRQLFQGSDDHVNGGLMRHPGGAQGALRGTSLVERLCVWGPGNSETSLKITYPASILSWIKGLLAQGLKAERWQNGLVNLLEDASHLLPLLIGHPRPTRISVEKRVHDHGPILCLCPQRIVPGGKGSHHRCNSLVLEVARNTASWFVERSGCDFKQIRGSLLAYHAIHPGVIIQSHRKKLKRNGDQVIVVL